MAYTPQRTIKELLESLLEATQSLRILQNVRGTLADLRVTPVGGVVTTVSTVTTVTTVSNQSSIGGFAANQQVPALQNTVAILSNINNIKIT
jgi:hypothetical protein